MAHEVSVQDLSSEQIKEDIELLHSYSVWKKLDSQLRDQGHLPVDTAVAGRQVANMKMYRAITQGYGDDIAILSIIIDGKPLGSAVFPKFDRQESDDLTDVNDFWRRPECVNKNETLTIRNLASAHMSNLAAGISTKSQSRFC